MFSANLERHNYVQRWTAYRLKRPIVETVSYDNKKINMFSMT